MYKVFRKVKIMLFRKKISILIKLSLFSILLIGCNVTKTDDDGNQISEKDLKATSSAQEQSKLSLSADKDQLKDNEKTLLSKPYLDSLGSFSSDVLKTAMRSLQHTYWVMAEASEMNKYLETAGIELVGKPIVPGNDKKAEFLDYGIVMSGGQAYVVTEMDKIIVAFRDTGSDKRWERILNMLTDARATLKKMSFLEDPKFSEIKAHEGFVSEYMLFREKVIEYVDMHPNKEIHVVGHSLGGALATIASFDIASTLDREVNTVTFGAPRVGTKDFRDAFESLPINLYRVVVANDPIARVPGMLIPYEHVGQLIQIDESGDMYDPADINTAILFTKRDFTNHYKSSYYFGIVGLYTYCENEKYEKCNESITKS